MKYKINREDLTNIKITAIEDILPNESIGIRVSTKPMSLNPDTFFNVTCQKKCYETDDLGIYCNHSLNPNTTIKIFSHRLELKANPL